MKKFFFALFILLFLPLNHAKASDDGWTITNFDTHLEIQSDGVLAVTENIAVDFAGLQKHGIYRYIPYKYQNKDGSYIYSEIKNVSVGRNIASEPYNQSLSSGNVVLKIGNANKTISGTQLYQIRYTVTGVLRGYDQYDELYWNATGNNWPVPIANASVSVALPEDGIVQASCYFGAYRSSESCQKVSSSAKSITYNQTNLSSGQGLTVAIGYRKGMVPILSVKNPSIIEKKAIISFLISFAFILIIGLIYLVRRWWKFGRDHRYMRSPSEADSAPEEAIPLGMKDTIAPEFAPPKGYKPAEIGVLIDEKADTVDVTATIVDMAVRGYLQIIEIPKKGILGKTEYKLKKYANHASDLSGYEKYLYDSLFLYGDGHEVTTKDLQNTFSVHLSELKKSLYQSVTLKMLFSSDPGRVKQSYLIVGLVMIVVTPFIIGTSASLFLTHGSIIAWAFLGVLSGIIAIGIATLLFAKGMPQKTALGHQIYMQARGYKLFIETAEKYRQRFLENENMFSELLPYAMVFAVTDKLAKAFDGMGIRSTELGWYQGTSNSFNYILFANSLSSFSQNFSTAMASVPGGSGGGGGGFSGGGFGGGGGGSW